MLNSRCLLFLNSILCSVVCFFCANSRADILFIRLNPADGEIAAAKSAAKARGENVIVIPPVNTADLKRIREIGDEESRLLKKAEAIDDSEKIDAISERLVQIMDEREAIAKRVSLNPQTLKQSLIEIAAAKIRLSSVVISSHDGNGKYWGLVGNTLAFEDFVAAFGSVPRLKEGIRSVALLGCYTSTLSALESYWRKVFPANAVYAGYEFKGPNATIPSGHAYLKEFLLRDEKFAAAKTKGEVLKLFNQLPQIKVLAASIGVGQFHVSNDGAQTIEEMYAECDGLLDTSALRTTYNCYYGTKPGCEDVPTDTKNGPIRKFYEKLQKTAHCIDIVPIVDGQAIPEPEVVLSLIFFNNIRDNFARLYRVEMNELNQWLKIMGIESLDLAGKSRGEIMNVVRERRQQAMTLQDDEPLPPDAKAEFILRFKVQSRLENIDRILLRLVNGCVPEAWVDPLVAGKSACLREERALIAEAEKNWKSRDGGGGK